MMIVLITGDRFWEGDIPKSPLYFPSRLQMLELLQSLPWDAIVREGCANGADHAAEEIAKSLGLQVEHYPADWEKKGKKAGPIRNRQMFWGYGHPGYPKKPDLVAAFHNDIKRSVGTKDMISVAEQFGVRYTLSQITEKDQ